MNESISESDLMTKVGVDLRESASGLISSSFARTEYLVHRADFLPIHFNGCLPHRRHIINSCMTMPISYPLMRDLKKFLIVLYLHSYDTTWTSAKLSINAHMSVMKYQGYGHRYRGGLGSIFSPGFS